jgi:hypothetical protein
MALPGRPLFWHYACYNRFMVDPLLKYYRDRWKAVEQFERQEQRSASVAFRWQQLNALLRLAIGLGLKVDQEDKQELIISQRWNRLKCIK